VGADHIKRITPPSRRDDLLGGGSFIETALVEAESNEFGLLEIRCSLPTEYRLGRK